MLDSLLYVCKCKTMEKCIPVSEFTVTEQPIWSLFFIVNKEFWLFLLFIINTICYLMQSQNWVDYKTFSPLTLQSLDNLNLTNKINHMLKLIHQIDRFATGSCISFFISSSVINKAIDITTKHKWQSLSTLADRSALITCGGSVGWMLWMEEALGSAEWACGHRSCNIASVCDT